MIYCSDPLLAYRLSRSFLRQTGYLTMITVVFIVIIGFIGMTVAYVFSDSGTTNTNFQSSNRALFIAESGLEAGTHSLLGYTMANRLTCSGLSLNNGSIGKGAYTVTSTGPFYVTSPTKLNGALTATATTIPVISTSNYQPSGRIMIDHELINYTAVNSTNFLNAVRGVDGSTATTHITGTVVSQNQCVLTATGGEPTLTPSSTGNPGGIRKLTENIQLQEAWAVGASTSIARFNSATWSNFASGLAATQLNSISMISYADGWVTGNNATNQYIAHWNGSTWTQQAANAAIPNVNLNGVYCNSTSDCHAVGAASGGNPVIIRWTGGPNWVRITPTGGTSNTLQSIHCDATSDCWAVGNNTGGTNFYQWNGTSWAAVSVPTLSGFTYNSVFCNAGTDCWAVGANATFARKNGATWGNFASGLPAVQYNSIYCNATNDCWVAGNASGQIVLGHWNGSAWSLNTSHPAPAVNLNSVKCANTNDCWAVGNTSGGQPVLDHWNGSVWSNITVTGLINAALLGFDIVHPNTQPWSTWSESFT